MTYWHFEKERVYYMYIYMPYTLQFHVSVLQTRANKYIYVRIYVLFIQENKYVYNFIYV